MNRISPPARFEYVTGDRSWLSGTRKLILMAGDHVDSVAHETLDQVAADVVATYTLTGLDVEPDGLAVADDLALTGIAPGTDYLGIWIYEDTGTPSTSRLEAWFDTQDNDTPLGGTTSGLDIALTWSSGVFRL